MGIDAQKTALVEDRGANLLHEAEEVGATITEGNHEHLLVRELERIEQEEAN